MKRLHDLSHDRQIAFYDRLIDRLPDTIHGADTKTSKSHFIDKYKAVHDHKFIRFNTKTAVNMLVFDLDYVKVDAEYWFRILYESTGIKFSWVSETTNGIQAGIFLDSPIFIKDFEGNDNKNRIRLSRLKKVIGQRLQFTFMGENVTLTDVAGSNRLLGVWRNPITHNTVISSNTYSMEFLVKHFKLSQSVMTPPPKRNTLRSRPTSCKMTLSPSSTIQNALNDGFHQGNRNNFMFAFGYKTLFEDRTTLSTIEAIMQNENAAYGNAMRPGEITAIAKSVETLADTMYQPTIKTKPTAKYREYMWTNNIHGKYNRQSFGAFTTAKTRRDNTATSLLDHLVSLFEAGISTPDNAEVVKGLDIQLRQYQNIKHDYQTGTIFLEWCFGMLGNTHTLGIRANCTPHSEEAFKGINKRVEKVFCEDGSVYFSMRDRDHWRDEIKTTYPPLQAAS